MKVKYLQDVNINSAIHPEGSVEEVGDRLAETMIRNGWVMDTDKVETESIPSVEPLDNVVEMPKKRTYETALKQETEKAVTVQKSEPESVKVKPSTVIRVPSLPKKPKKVKDDKKASGPRPNK